MMSQQARLIIVAGLPGSGKTTLARQLESALPALRLSADDWMLSLGINLHAERDRDHIEKLQWLLAERLLTLGNTVIIDGAPGANGKEQSSDTGTRTGSRSGAPLSYGSLGGTVSTIDCGIWRTRQFSGKRCRVGKA